LREEREKKTEEREIVSQVERKGLSVFRGGKGVRDVVRRAHDLKTNTSHHAAQKKKIWRIAKEEENGGRFDVQRKKDETSNRVSLLKEKRSLLMELSTLRGKSGAENGMKPCVKGK